MIIARAVTPVRQAVSRASSHAIKEKISQRLKWRESNCTLFTARRKFVCPILWQKHELSYGENQLCHCCFTTSSHNTTSKTKPPSPHSSAKESQLKDTTSEVTQQLSIFQRFKQAYKEHGKVLVGVHLATSTVWFGSFFYIAQSGVDVVGILERLGVVSWLLDPLRDSSLGHAAVAYLMYKLATPARYTVTLGGTSLVIRQFKKTGRIQQPDVKVRELVRESADKVKDKLEDRVDDMRERVGERVEQTKDRIGERYQEGREKLSRKRK